MPFNSDMRFGIILKRIFIWTPLSTCANGFFVRNSTQQVLEYLQFHYATFCSSHPEPAKKYSPKGSPCSRVQAAQTRRQMRPGFERRNPFPLSFHSLNLPWD